MFARTYSATPVGIDGALIEIEAACHRSLPTIHITGLPGDIVKESRERIRAALVCLGFEVPTSRIVIHLSPANIKKQGSQFDLGIAISVLVAEGFLTGVDISKYGFLGELSLDGRIQRISGAIALIETLERDETIGTLLIPYDNSWEANLLKSRKARLVHNLADAIEFLRGNKPLPLGTSDFIAADPPALTPLLNEIVGQLVAKRALQIALAGRHHLLLVGPPGVGKSMLASSAPSLLPLLDLEELIEVTKNYGPAQMPRPIHFSRPFRSPHHTISAHAFLGGGTGSVIPGEVSLAHAGVLFLDEFPEFRRDAIEGLREPLESGRIHLHRVGHAMTLPARFTLIAAMNPCPCGYYLTPTKKCSCGPERIASYRKKISGPILDRMDLCVVLSTPRTEEVLSLSHEEVKAGIQKTFEIQCKRYRNFGGVRHNGEATVDLKAMYFHLGKEESSWFGQLRKREELSHRSFHKILRIARTIADLEEQDVIHLDHLRQAWSLRCPKSYPMLSLC